jgi:hypothetical protein
VLLSLVAALPTFQGSPTNRWMIAATLGGPFLAGAGIFFLVRPVLRRIAPGLLLETGSSGSMDPWMITGLGVGAALTLGLSVHTVQAWLEIGLHRDLLGVRWPGAATVTTFAGLMWLVVGKLILDLRRS